MSEDDKLLKEAKKLPWDERLLHKNWKVRIDANADLATVFDSIADPKDHRFREIGHLFKKTVSDSNAPVQEKALDALVSYLKAADADAGRLLMNLFINVTGMLCQIWLIFVRSAQDKKAAKWSERKDAVEELTKLASTKRISPGDFSEICRTLKKAC
ncbi:unnamed protein product [Cuscuta campestris]|uniref:XMAP215/Dis1/CLASP TOG domain-containing protein n=1 Tax=Cuscuta campestris TaxID=132261 RepID=A0A484MHT2_9ASTE|nr:unnamed protein product [Cuscuta campestris]